MKQVFNFLLAMFIFLSATAFIPGHGFGEIQGNVFKIGVAVLFVMSLFMKPVRYISVFWVNCIAALALVTTILQPDQAKIIAVEGLVYVFMGVALLYVLIQHLEDFAPILNGICAVVILNVIMIVLQIGGVDPICIGDTGQRNTHMVGLFGFKYVFGAYMGLIAPLLIFSRRKLFGVVAVILNICSMSWASVACCFLSLVFGSYFINRKIFVITIAAVVGLWVAAYSTLLNQSVGQTFQYKLVTRLHLESKYLPALFSKAATGYGLATFKTIGPQIYYEKKFGAMTDAWNDYLERGMECGIGMIVLMCTLFWDTMKRFLKSRKTTELIALTAALLTIPTGILFHDYFNHFSLTTLMIAFLAMLEIRLKEDADVSQVYG